MFPCLNLLLVCFDVAAIARFDAVLGAIGLLRSGSRLCIGELPERRSIHAFPIAALVPWTASVGFALSPTPVESLKYSSTNPGVGGILPMENALFPSFQAQQ